MVSLIISWSCRNISTCTMSYWRHKHPSVVSLPLCSLFFHSLGFNTSVQQQSSWVCLERDGRFRRLGDIMLLQAPANCLSPSLCSFPPLLPCPNPLLIPSTPTFHPPTLLTIPKHGLSMVHSLNLNYRTNCYSSRSGLLLFFPAEGAFSVRGPQTGGEACGSA